MAEIPGEVILVGNPVVGFPALATAAGPDRVQVIPVEIPGSAFLEAFLVKNVAEGGDFVPECRMAVSRKVASRQVVAVVGVATVEAGH